jgi:glycosyltransferase involved in cell wall biosynthesis
MSMILNGLSRDRFELVATCPDESPMMAMLEDLKVKTRSLQPLQARFTWRPDLMIRYLASFVQVIRCARRVVIDEAPDAIHANSIRAGMVMAAATMGMDIPVIWHAHDILPHHPLSTAIRLFAAVTNRNRIVGVSKAVSDRFRGVILRPMKRRVPIQVIHNAVDLERFQSNAKVRYETRRTLGLKDNQLVVGTVGQLTPRKGQLELIRAFSRTKQDVKDAVLLVVGAALFNRDDRYVEQLQREAVSLGVADDVCFLGPREDIPQLLQGIDLLVVNSHEEPFALTVLEGLSSGTAVLATAVGGIPEMIRHGQNGWLVPARNHNALVDAMGTLLRDEILRSRLGRNGRHEATSRFSMERYLREVENLYAGVVKRDQADDQDNASRPLDLEMDRLKGAAIFRSLF